MRWRRWLGFLLGTLAYGAEAHADLGADVQTLIAARTPYGQLVRSTPRLLERGDRLPLSVPSKLLDAHDASCTTVTVLGVIGLHFAVRFSRLDPGAPSNAEVEPSTAGASEITRCGSSKPYLSGVLLEMRSPRGVIETVISNAPAGVPRLLQILPERDPGGELSAGDPGAPPAPASLSERQRRLLARAQREGALSFQQQPWPAAEDGTGGGPVLLAPGCHELTLLAEAPTKSEPPIDLDLELFDGESGERLAVDRADDADAALSVCVGAPTRAELRFIGAPSSARLSLTHAHWDLPRGVPGNWGPVARAHLASVARAQHLRLQRLPVYSSLGVQGSTSLPLEVEPGACYSALFVPLRGEVRNLSLSVRAHAVGEIPRLGSDPAGGAVSFCAHGARRASLEVEADGDNLAWFLALWESGRTALGVHEK